MNFSNLYKENKNAVEETLTAMWCSNARNEVQKTYADQIRNLIKTDLFASEKYVPLVQCMEPYRSLDPNQKDEANKLIGGLWTESYLPYKHQYEAWKALSKVHQDGSVQSMVVTTGTGSGKTECFMLPLIHNLKELNRNQAGERQIQAIFLYPLNALMEDQKERLQEYLKGTNLKFAVYNGNLPENEKGSPEEQKRIEDEKAKYQDIIPTRTELRTNHPNILLTNPTMLEYMLLRNVDQQLFTKGSLKWIVIDEAHTYSGAGAAELAMLIRRVLDAFGVEPQQVRFAMSSATIGNVDETDEEKRKVEEKRNDEQLCRFISQLSGVPIDESDPLNPDNDKNHVSLIKGDREPHAVSNNEEIEACREKLVNNDYMRLDELIPEGTIDEKLKKLDAMCEEENGLKAKLHLFYRVPNNGLKVQLTDSENGVFKIKTTIPLDDESTPYLELARCQHCGEYFAVAESSENPADEYHAVQKDLDDIFSPDSNKDPGQNIIFSLTKKTEVEGGNKLFSIKGNKIFENTSVQDANGWRIIGNVHNRCPHCNTALMEKEKKDAANDKDQEESRSTDLSENVTTFRLSAAFISRVLAPTILPELSPDKNNPDNKPHKGQQYISFVDSRQTAARSTMQQNLEEERMWILSRVFHKLCEEQKDAPQKRQRIQQDISDLENAFNTNKIETVRNTLRAEIDKKEKELRRLEPIYLTWEETFNYLMEQPESDWLAYQFANKSKDSKEYDAEKRTITLETKMRYVLRVMVEQFDKRPRKAAAPETMGLITTYYKKLDKITLPPEVKEFNDKYLSNSKPITLDDWRDFLKIYLDYVVRSNQSIYLKLSSDKRYSGIENIDIFKLERFASKKEPRRTAHQIKVNDKKSDIKQRHILYLAALIDPNSKDLQETAFSHRDDIDKVLKAMWEQLIKIQLISPSQKCPETTWLIDKDHNNPGLQYRLNVADISFKLYDQACLCDTRRVGETLETLRPVDTLFMGYSPYLINNKPVQPVIGMQKWETFPFIKGIKDEQKLTKEELGTWAKEKRPLLWDNGLWGENGCFMNRLNSLYLYPEIFIQAEHTAQVDKIVARQSQDQFKTDKTINVLACSTTMEMGVDIGALELVMMTSIPPHPSNYKQRAGRSGRNKDKKSVCITLCGSDAIGLRTLYSPMEHLIQRRMAVPTVDLMSPQVIQRHVNAFLLRSSNLLSGEIRSQVIDFFTPFLFDRDHADKYDCVYASEDRRKEKSPIDGLGDVQNTLYWSFLGFINGLKDNKAVYENMLKLLHLTCLDNNPEKARDTCRENMEDCYRHLKDIADDISAGYQKEYNDNPQKQIGVYVDTPTANRILVRYKEMLSENLIQFFATDRFTPNANMPVNIVEFAKNQKRNVYKPTNNPSYPLREAISQYAPGNTIVLENRTYVVRGLLYTGIYKHDRTRSFKTIYSDGEQAVIDKDNVFPDDKKYTWPVNNRKCLEMIEPISFIPDVNEDTSRKITQSPYTQVSAQLVGAKKWDDVSDTLDLVSMRTNRESSDARILYYNEGIGFGYAFCPNCGKAVFETSRSGKVKTLPSEIIKHKNIYIYRGGVCKDKEIRRNIIIGGLITTDYCEIRIRDAATDPWRYVADSDTRNLLITLGVVVTKCFIDYIGKDRNDVDFAIMPNAHLCIFDTNPGGSGYSPQLYNRLTMREVLKSAYQTLKEVPSKDALLDKFTYRYIDHLDVSAAKTWVEQAIKAFEAVPDDVVDKYGDDVKVAYFQSIYEDVKASTGECVLFVNKYDGWADWAYLSDYGWQGRIQPIRSLNIRKKNVRVAFVGGKFPAGAEDDLKRIEDWATVSASDNSMADGLYPLALTEKYLYFTNSIQSATMNCHWASEGIYRIPRALMSFKFSELILNKTEQFIIGKGESKNIKTKELGAVVEERIQSMVDNFVAHCKQHHVAEMRITYQDEHLKSKLGMVTTIQMIDYFVNKFGNLFTLRFINEEYDEKIPDKQNPDYYYNDYDRNDALRDYISTWDNKLLKEPVIIDTKMRRMLTHWRELRFECAGKAFVLYPNGGIINEWFLDKYKGGDSYNISLDENIPIFHRNEIMYNAVIMDV